VDKGLAVQSLVPYLDKARHPFVLKLAFPGQPKGHSGNLPDPFVVLYDSDPLTRVFMGKMVTDTGDAFKDIFLLTQRDGYPRSVPALDVLTNRAVDGLWQDAFRLRNTSGGKSITLSANLKGDKTFLPFRSLFYCAFRDRFFHPPCPTCGGLLDLCRADERLKAGGLPPYSASLDRYLYCPSCSEVETAPGFYAPSKGKNDPPSLLDAGDLIRAFGKIDDDVTGAFPCGRCSEKVSCYGAEGKALRRIFPFSFFPFYLLAFEAYPAHAMDFLGLVSGASPEREVAVLQEQKKSVPEEPLADERTPASKETAIAVTKLIVNIRKKWQADLERIEKADEARQEVMEPEAKPVPEPMLEKTMFFSPGALNAMSSTPGGTPKEKTPPVAPTEPPAQEIQLEKTMIFSPDTVGRIASPPPPTPPVSGDRLKETVIQAPDTIKVEETRPVPPEKKAEAVPETIIMSLDDLKGKKHDR
jgi:hypothetical protein